MSISITSATITLDCDSLKYMYLCPGDNDQRMCTCVNTGGVGGLRLMTDQEGIFNIGNEANLANADTLGTVRSAKGFNFTLTNRTMNHFTGVLTFTPADLSPAGLSMTCLDINFVDIKNTTTVAVTYAGTDKHNYMYILVVL